MSDKKGAKGKTRVTGDEPSSGSKAGVAAAGDSNGAANGSNAKSVVSSLPPHSPSFTAGAASRPRCTSLLNLEVKVLTQTLGAENQWSERGDGRVEFVDFTIRVVASRASASEGAGGGTKGEGNGEGAVAASPTAGGVDGGEEDGVVILEDTITSETPFVGENCCIVWNSFDQGLSMCLMYASEEGYSASWSALVALQEKAYPPLHIDLLSNCLPPEERSSVSNDNDDNDGDAGGEGRPKGANGSEGGGSPNAAPNVPYSYYIHHLYRPPLGFIENHAISLSILEHGHASRKQLYEDRDTVLALLNLANADLLEHLLTREVYPLLAEGLGCPIHSGKTNAGSEAANAAESNDWAIPAALSKLTLPEESASIISKELRLGHLQQIILPLSSDSTELILKLSSISHRLRNELACTLLSSDTTLREARDALMVQLPPSASAAAAARHKQPAETAGGGKAGRAAPAPNSSGDSSAANGSMAAVVEACTKAEQQVLAHLQFFRSLVSLSIVELGKELVGPVVVKVLQSGLLEALSIVAERFGMPSGASQSFLSAIQEGGGGGGGGSGSGVAGGGGLGNRRTSTVGASWYSPAVEGELTMLLDVLLVRLNERQEEQLINELVRTPVLNDPVKFNGLVTFMMRQLALGSTGSSGSSSGKTSLGDISCASHSPPLSLSSLATGPTPFLASSHSSAAGPPRSCALSNRPRVLHDCMSTRNPHVLYHVLGLHDDEGSAAAERALDPESTEVRNRFHNFIITKYFFQASRGSLVPVPLPPAAGGGAPKSAPIIQFSNAGATQNFAQGISPAFLRVLEYLVNIATPENREALLKIVFNHKSHIMHYIESCCEFASTNRRSIGLDVLASCMRFMRTIIAQIAVSEAEAPENPMALFAPPPEPLPKALVTTICRQLTVERDTFGIILKAYHKIGGTRRNTVFHSAVLSLLELIDHHVPAIKDSNETDDSVQGNNDLRDIRDYLFLKHLSLLPSRFERKFRESLLSEVSSRLGRDSYTPNDSVSVLSSTASEMLRSSSKLRFVDEVEAAIGGVDGTVLPETVSNLSPVIVGNVHSSEDKRAKKLRTTMDLLGSNVGNSGSGGQLRGANSPGPGHPVKAGVAANTMTSPNSGGMLGGTSTAANSNSNSSPAANPFRGPSPGATGGNIPKGANAQLSPPMTVHISRPESNCQLGTPPSGANGGGNGTLSPSAELVTSIASNAGPAGALKPVAPSTERPAVRPRSGGGVGVVANAGGSSPPQSTLPPQPGGRAASSPPPAKPAAPTTGGSSAKAGPSSGSPPPGGDTLVLPKIRKRTAAVNGKR